MTLIPECCIPSSAPTYPQHSEKRHTFSHKRCMDVRDSVWPMYLCTAGSLKAIKLGWLRTVDMLILINSFTNALHFTQPTLVLLLLKDTMCRNCPGRKKDWLGLVFFLTYLLPTFAKKNFLECFISVCQEKKPSRVYIRACSEEKTDLFKLMNKLYPLLSFAADQAKAT